MAGEAQGLRGRRAGPFVPSKPGPRAGAAGWAGEAVPLACLWRPLVAAGLQLEYEAVLSGEF